MENETKEVAQVATIEQATSAQNGYSMSVFGSEKNFVSAQRMARALCMSSIVPANFQGEKNLANCLIALEMANRMEASPLMVMQNLYVVHGNVGWSSKFLIATLNACGKFSPLRYKMTGEKGKDTWGCIAYAIDKSTGEELYGAEVTIKMAKDEGWFNKPGSKWKTMPELMLQYRASAFFQRAYAPEVSMGLMTADEVQETVQDAVIVEDSTATQPDNGQKVADAMAQSVKK